MFASHDEVGQVIDDAYAAGLRDGRTEAEMSRNLLAAAECIKETGGSVEMYGVRMEPCDEWGATSTTRHVTNMRAALAAIRDLCEARTSDLPSLANDGVSARAVLRLVDGGEGL